MDLKPTLQKRWKWNHFINGTMNTISWNTTSSYYMLNTTVFSVSYSLLKPAKIQKHVLSTTNKKASKALMFRRHDVVSIHRWFVGKPISSFTSWTMLGKWESKLNWVLMLFSQQVGNQPSGKNLFLFLYSIITFLYAKVTSINKPAYNKSCCVSQLNTDSNQITDTENAAK